MVLNGFWSLSMELPKTRENRNFYQNWLDCKIMRLYQFYWPKILILFADHRTREMIILTLGGLSCLMPSLKILILEKLCSRVGSLHGLVEGLILLFKSWIGFSRLWSGNKNIHWSRLGLSRGQDQIIPPPNWFGRPRSFREQCTVFFWAFMVRTRGILWFGFKGVGGCLSR
jgi:hypothetical protein